jgi:hypothetical protein
MSASRIRMSIFVILAAFLSANCSTSQAFGKPQGQPAAQSGAKPIGTIKAITENSITLASDAGAVFNVSVDGGAKILRIEPGAKDLKNAEPMQLGELQAGDRILVVGKVGEDGHSVAATSVIVMKKADVASRQERDRMDWQRRGLGGLVTAVDVPDATITISTQSLAGSKSVTVRTSKDTILRRYAPDSVKFDDAKVGTIDQIKSGDQLRARGMRSADGSDLAAEEVVSGAFRNIAGTVSSLDAAANTVSVMDLVTKQPVLVKVTPESQLRKLPPQMAQFMAMRLKGAGGSGSGGAEGTGTRQSGATTPTAAPSSAAVSSGDANAATGAERGGRGAGGGGDLQQMLSRVPSATLTDLQKGDAVMIVSTEGNGSGTVTAITLVAGVEPILQASANGGGQSMILPPWSLDASGGDAAQ